MRKLNTNRRGFVAAAAATVAAGALLPTRGTAQTGNSVTFGVTKFRSDKAGEEHTYRLKQIKTTLDERKATSAPGLSKLVDALVKPELITPQGAALLKRLIEEMILAKTVEMLLKLFFDAVKALNKTIDEVSQAVVRIAQESVQWVKANLGSDDVKKAIVIVASDVSGALTGAATGGQLGGVSGALIGAVIGAVSSSAVAVFG